MEFRFPHPFENIGDAVKDALDPNTDADGSLAMQLLNENNRAVEDRFAEIVTGSSYYDTFTSGTLSVPEWYEPTLFTLAPGKWSVALYVSGYLTASDSFTDNVALYVDGAMPDNYAGTGFGATASASNIYAYVTIKFNCVGGPVSLGAIITSVSTAYPMPTILTADFTAQVVAFQIP